MGTYLWYSLIISLLAIGASLIIYKPSGYLKRGNIRVLEGKIKESKAKILFDEKVKAWRRNRQNKMIDKEIYEAISFLRNIISIDMGKRVGSDFIIEQFAEKDGVLQETYIKMLSLLRVNKRKEAQKLMGDRLETSIGKEFSGLLIKWDEINPLELSEILLSHQKSIKEIRMTQQRKRDETISDILYFPVIVNVVLLFINFIYVGYFIDQKEVLQMLF